MTLRDLFPAILLALGPPPFRASITSSEWFAEFERILAINGYGPQYSYHTLFGVFVQWMNEQ